MMRIVAMATHSTAKGWIEMAGRTSQCNFRANEPVTFPD